MINRRPNYALHSQWAPNIPIFGSPYYLLLIVLLDLRYFINPPIGQKLYRLQ